MDTPIGKPALLRQIFELGAAYSGELLSLNKMLGSLQDAGNTSTLSGYLNLLAESGLLCGLKKYSIDMARRRASIPKLQVYNNALKTVYSPMPFNQAVLDRKSWGRIFESGVGPILSVRHLSTDSTCSIGASAMMRWISYFARRIHWWQLRSRAMRRNVLKVWTSSEGFSSRHRHSLCQGRRIHVDGLDEVILSRFFIGCAEERSN